MALSLSLPCAQVCLNLSTLFRNGVSASHNTLTLASNTRHVSKRTNKMLAVQARSQSDYYEMQQHLSSRPQDDGFGSNTFGGQSPKVFVGYSMYKGKGAVTVSPKGPEFIPIDSGLFKVSRDGCVFLQFAPGIGDRQYDWTRKQVFTLSVEEIGTLVSLGPKDKCEFFHDPFLGKSEEGQVRKVLKVEPLPDGSGHFFNLNVNDRLKNVEEDISISVTKGEFTILRSCLNYLIPHLLGWNTFANSIGPGRANNFSRPDLEWDR